jgi:uncharacterized Ntn-hydrolase superfamily protein
MGVFMLNRYIYLTLLILTFWYTYSGAQSTYSKNLAHTFSIVARDSVTGEMGVAVQTHWFAVGTRVSWAEAGVGAIATQSFTNVSFGPLGLALLKEGLTAEEVLKQLIESDEGREVRQVGIIDSRGNIASWTGDHCISEAGHLAGKNFSVQANMMLTEQVWPAMSMTFQETKGPLAERLLAALEAGQAAGGDIRGRQSAAMIIVGGKSTGNSWEGRQIDLRVDDHKDPIGELKRLLKVSRAYQHMNNGDKAIETNDIKTAQSEYSKAQKLAPANLEMKYWHAVSLANIGMVKESLPIFKEIFVRDANWWILTKRLPKANLLKISKDDFNKILSQK